MDSPRNRIIERVGLYCIRDKHWNVDTPYITRLLFVDRKLMRLWRQVYGNTSPTGLPQKAATRLVNDVVRYFHDDVLPFRHTRKRTRKQRKTLGNCVRISADVLARLR